MLSQGTHTYVPAQAVSKNSLFLAAATLSQVQGVCVWSQVSLVCAGSGSNVGAIVGGVIGGIVGLIALIVLTVCICCRCKNKNGNSKQAAPPTFDNNQGFVKTPAAAPVPYQKPPNGQYGMQPGMQPQGPVNYNGPGSQAGFAVQTNPATSTGALLLVASTWDTCYCELVKLSTQDASPGGQVM